MLNLWLALLMMNQSPQSSLLQTRATHNAIAISLQSFTISKDGDGDLATIKIKIANHGNEPVQLSKWDLETAVVRGFRLWKVESDEVYQLIPTYVAGTVFAVPMVDLAKGESVELSFLLIVKQFQVRNGGSNEIWKEASIPKHASFCADLRIMVDVIDSKNGGATPCYAESMTKLWFHSQ